MRPQKRRYTGFCSRFTGASGRLPRHRPACSRAGLNGYGQLGLVGHARVDGADIWFYMSRRRPDHESPEGQENDLGWRLTRPVGSLAEEAPAAYKDVDRVVAVVHGAGIAKKVARIVPVAVIKG
jgi:hypothetical protein